MNISKFCFAVLCTTILCFSSTSSFAQATGCHQIDWETDCMGNPFPEGLYVPSNAYDCIGLTVTNNETLPLVLFNSAAPTGNDPDLGTPSENCPTCNAPMSCPGTSNNPNGGLTNCVPQGLILITEENPVDANMDGLEDNPDDHNVSDVTFSFVNPVTINTLSFVDDSQGTITFTFADGSTQTTTLTGGLDNDVYTQIFNNSDVTDIRVELTSSGAVSIVDFCYDVPGGPTCDLIAPVLGADVDICAGDDPGPIEVLSNASGTGTIMYQWQQSLTGCNGFGDIAGATSSSYNPGVLFQSTYFRVVVTTMTSTLICTEASNCIAYTEIMCTMCVPPVVTASAEEPSCIGGVPQSDGFLEIQSISVGDRYHYSLGSTFDDNGGMNTYANATNISGASFPIQFAMGQPNPSGSQDYTIRVYNSEADCYTDEVVTMMEVINCPIYDFGDLPDTGPGTSSGNYKTLDSDNGPSHQIISGLSIGTTVDDELDGQQSMAANGDAADEDGFDFSMTTFVIGNPYDFPINVTNTTGMTAYFDVWIDWNGNGNFNDPGEMIANLSDDGAGNFGQANITVNVPAGAPIGPDLGVRARLSHMDNVTPLGQVDSGEVEDYFITVCGQQICLPVTVVKN